MLPAANRLRRRADFTAAVRGPGAVRAGSRLLVVHMTSTPIREGQPARVGFVVPRAVGGAVLRNRTKRRLRAAARAMTGELPDGTDVVVRAQAGSGEVSFAVLNDELKTLSEKAIRRIDGSR